MTGDILPEEIEGSQAATFGPERPALAGSYGIMPAGGGEYYVLIGDCKRGTAGGPGFVALFCVELRVI